MDTPKDTRNSNQDTNKKKFDLVPRCAKFAKNCKTFVFSIPEKSDDRIIYGRQLLRSSSSIGANYIEANDALGKKDFIFRIRIARKEANETLYWLELIDKSPAPLKQECLEIKNILSVIIQKIDKS